MGGRRTNDRADTHVSLKVPSTSTAPTASGGNLAILFWLFEDQRERAAVVPISPAMLIGWSEGIRPKDWLS